MDTLKCIILLNQLGIGNSVIISQTKLDFKVLDYDYCNSNFDIGFISKSEFDKIRDKVLEKIDSVIKNEFRVLTFKDPLYPKELISSNIIYFFYLGNISLLESKKVGFVGSRKATMTALENTLKYSRYLSKNGYTIVTGLALGVDTYATLGSLEESSRCIEILPCPLNKITPSSNSKLLDKVIDNGGLAISVYFPDSRTYNSCYIDRNKIIALLSNSVIVGETETSGGTISTVKFSVENGKKVYFLNFPSKLESLSEEKIIHFKKKYNGIIINTRKVN